MTWSRLSDEIFDDIKVKRAIRAGGSGAAHLYIGMIVWCSKHLTDGHVPADMLPDVAGPEGAKARKKALDALVEFQLVSWSSTLGAQVANYLKFNRSAAEVLAERSRWVDRQQNHRVRENVTGGVTRGASVESRVESRVESQRPVPVPVPNQEIHSSSSARPNVDQRIPFDASERTEAANEDRAEQASPHDGVFSTQKKGRPCVEEGSEPSPVVSEPKPLHGAPGDTRRATELEAVKAVFDEWRKVFGHPKAELEEKRTARIRSRLKNFTVEQLVTAFRGALKDDWIMGCDPKSTRKFDGLETVLRDTAQVERLIELAEGGASKTVPRPAQTGTAAEIPGFLR